MVFGVFLSISKQCIQCTCDHVWCYCLCVYIMCGFTLVGPQQAGTGQESVGKYVGPRPAYWAACATSPLSPRWNVATKRGAQQSFLLLPECPARQRPVLPAFTQPSLDGCTVFPAFTNLSNSTKDKVTKHAKEVERTQVAGHGGHRSLDCTSCIFCPRELPTQPTQTTQLWPKTNATCKNMIRMARENCPTIIFISCIHPLSSPPSAFPFQTNFFWAMGLNFENTCIYEILRCVSAKTINMPSMENSGLI